MHDIWNPWHGCIKKSEGCDHCYMYAIDGARGLDGSNIHRVKQNFDLPLQRFRNGDYKIPSGAHIRVCMNSDFFLEQADPWRGEVWDIIRKRPDVLFWLLTKRPERMACCLPPDWGDGWENVFLNVTTENQRRADERLPILLATPARHRGFMAAPLIGAVDASAYLATGGIEYMITDGENYAGARPCDYSWVKSLHDQAVKYDVTFDFSGTGEWFIKDGHTYHIDRRAQAVQAKKSGLSYKGREFPLKLADCAPDEQLSFIPGHVRQKHWGKRCAECESREKCLGCIGCGQC